MLVCNMLRYIKLSEKQKILEEPLPLFDSFTFNVWIPKDYYICLNKIST